MPFRIRIIEDTEGEGFRLAEGRKIINAGYALVSFLAALSLLAVLDVQDTQSLLAAGIPVLLHETSHLVMLMLLGFRIRSVRLQPTGLCIRYDGLQSARAHMAAALAGPLGGVLYALTAARLSERFALEWLKLSADLSLLLSAFNLLPIQPLDGGRFFAALAASALGEERGQRLGRNLSLILLAAVMAAGLLLSVLGKGNALFAAGLWLTLLQNEQLPLVNTPELL